MKKLLFSLAVAILSFGTVNAQFVTMEATRGTLVKNTETFAIEKPVKKMPKKAELGQNQYLMGGYTTDDIAAPGEGVGLTNVPGDLKAAIMIPTSDLSVYNGGKLVKMRVGLANAATVSRVFIIPVTKTGIQDEIVSQEVNFNAAGWNEVELEKAITLNLSDYEAILMGFDYVQTSNSYPLSLVYAGANSYDILIYGKLGSEEGWYNLGNSYGNLSVQGVVEMELPEMNLAVNGLNTNAFAQSDKALTWEATVTNMGSAAITSLGFDALVDDVVVGSADVTTNITTMQTGTISGQITLPAEISLYESHKLSLKTKTVNGDTPKGTVTENALSATFILYKDKVAHQKQLIEHFTSWTCTYCPLGYTLLRALEKNYNDIAWISVHGNQSPSYGKDPLYFDAVDDLQDMENLEGWPGASYNRTYIKELAEGSESLIYGLGYNVDQYLNQLVPYFREIIDATAEATPAFASLAIEQEYDNESRKLKLNVKGTGVEGASKLLADDGITVYLTESGITGRQYNQGTWVNDYEHNNALRAVLTSTVGEAPTWDGENFTYSVEYTIPDNFVAENLSITAVLAPIASVSSPDLHNMAVNNAEKVALETTSGIAGVQTKGDNTVEVARYNANGQQIGAPQKGINILRMSNGTTRKVMVK